jgi:hypothetical protein
MGTRVMVVAGVGAAVAEGAVPPIGAEVVAPPALAGRAVVPVPPGDALGGAVDDPELQAARASATASTTSPSVARPPIVLMALA